MPRVPGTPKGNVTIELPPVQEIPEETLEAADRFRINMRTLEQEIEEYLKRQARRKSLRKRAKEIPA